MTERSSSYSSSDRMEIVLDSEVIDAMDTSTAEGDDAKYKNDNGEEIENAEKLKDVTAGSEEQKDAAATEGATSGLDDAGTKTGYAIVNPSAVRVYAGRSMDVDDATPDASILSSPDYIKWINNEPANTPKTESRANILMNQTIMDIVEDELQKVTERICIGPPEAETRHQVAPPPLVSQPPPHAFQPLSLASQSPPLMFLPPPLMYQSSPQVTQPSPRAPTSDFSVTAGPSRYLLAHRPTRRKHLRPARQARYDRANRGDSGTTALRRTRIVRSGPGCAQPPPVVFPALYPTPQHATRKPETYQTGRQLLNSAISIVKPSQTLIPRFTSQLLNPSISIVNPSQTLTPRYTSQYSPQSPPMVFKQASSPTRLVTSCPATFMPSSPSSLVSMSAPRSSPILRPQSRSSLHTELFDLPYVSDVRQQPLDLSLQSRQLPTLIPISPALIARTSETRTVARPRFTPRTHTVTSTNNTVVDYPRYSLTRTEEPYQTTNRIEMYKSCSEHLLTQPSTRYRTRTPTNILSEHLQYQTWPVDNLIQTDNTEEVKTTEVDAWFNAIEASDIAAAIAASLHSSQPAPVTRPPPMIVTVPPLSPVRSPDTTRTTSPPRTTSS